MVVVREPGQAPGVSTAHTWRWLWAALALSMGLFIGGAGPIAWLAPVTTVLAGLVGLARGRAWASPTLWVGSGLLLGVGLQMTLALVRADDAGVLPAVG